MKEKEAELVKRKAAGAGPSKKVLLSFFSLPFFSFLPGGKVYYCESSPFSLLTFFPLLL